MNRARDLTKRLLSRSPSLYRAAQRLYHEARFRYSSAKLKQMHPGLRVVRYTDAELARQREAGFQSQFGQDFFVVTEFFAGRRGGVFLDIGCNQPEYLNNTNYLERREGWTGLAFDPIARYGDAWRSERTAVFVPVALGATEDKREFVEIENREGWANMMSAFADKARPEDLRMGFKRYAVTVRRASDVLDEHDVREVDFASIDVEGAEIDVLSGLDLKRHGPKVLLIENTQGLTGDEGLREQLKAQGYRFHARIWTCDDVYVKI
jgi:FkbM family methyltransferase